MLLRSSLLILFLVNIVSSSLIHMSVVFGILVTINLWKNKNLSKDIGKLKLIIYFYLGTCVFQLFYIQEGRILLTIYKYHITMEGVVNLSRNFLRIINLLMISWLINSKEVLRGPLRRYQLVIETVMELVPEAINLFKKKMKVKWFIRHIMKQIRVKK